MRRHRSNAEFLQVFPLRFVAVRVKGSAARHDLDVTLWKQRLHFGMREPFGDEGVPHRVVPVVSSKRMKQLVNRDSQDGVHHPSRELDLDDPEGTNASAFFALGLPGASPYQFVVSDSRIRVRGEAALGGGVLVGSGHGAFSVESCDIALEGPAEPLFELDGVQALSLVDSDVDLAAPASGTARAGRSAPEGRPAPRGSGGGRRSVRTAW